MLSGKGGGKGMGDEVMEGVRDERTFEPIEIRVCVFEVGVAIIGAWGYFAPPQICLDHSGKDTREPCKQGVRRL